MAFNFGMATSNRLLAWAAAGGLFVSSGVCGMSASSIDAALVIDGQAFTQTELQRKTAAATFQARTALFQAERKAADEFVDNYLLEREARKLNITVQQLLEKEAYANLAKDPSDEALRVYYDGIDTPQPFEAVRDKILETVRERRMTKAKAAYLQSLRSRASITVRLAAPRATINTDNMPVRGAAGAPVTLVEYADYECPYCQQVKPVVDQLQKEFDGKIAFVYKDVPLPMHANAQKASEASHCAGEQGKYWEYHDLLFATKAFAPGQLKEHARSLNIDPARFDQCLDGGAQAERIKGYVAEAQAMSLPGTPGFFVNGRIVAGPGGAVDYQLLRQAIEEELSTATGHTETARVGGR